MGTLTGIGIWSSELRYGDIDESTDAAAELEGLGYSVLWIPDVGGPVFEVLDALLEATSTVTIATGILNIWQHAPDDLTSWWSGLSPARQDRVHIGLGVSHGPLIGDRWGKPLQAMRDFLDAIEKGGPPAEQLSIAALGPKMLELAHERTSGACPYLVPPEHTAQARAALGDDGLYVEQGVILETDPKIARGIAREQLAHYFTLPNYVNNWKRLGFTEDDVESQSDRLIDRLVAWGDIDVISVRVSEHFIAGADHVCVQALLPGRASPRDAWRKLAKLNEGRAAGR